MEALSGRFSREVEIKVRIGLGEAILNGRNEIFLGS